MRVAALYDIHGNLPALEAVLAEVESLAPDLILVGGDLAAGPMPGETLERLMDLGDRACFIRGNGEREVVAWYDGQPAAGHEKDSFAPITAWTAQRISRQQRDFLAGLAEQAVIDVEGLGAVLFCHGSPRSDEEIITAATPDSRLGPMLEGATQSVIVCGHTHMQFERRARGKRVLNAGSVGMPYEGKAGAYWLLLGREAVWKRTAYDVAQAAELIRRSDMPDAEGFAEENVLHPPAAVEATTIFERAVTGE